MQTKSKHNPADWARLCNRATELVPRCGSRAEAFKAACAENPQLNSTPPSGADVRVNGSSPADTQPEAGGGKAKPWAVVFRDIGVQTKSEGTKRPDGALPWRKVFADLETRK